MSLENRIARLRALSRANRVVSSSLDTAEVLRAVTVAAAELTGARLATFWLPDDAGESVEAIAFSDPALGASLPTRRLRLGEGAPGRALERNERVDVPDVLAGDRTESPDWWRQHGVTSAVAIPVADGTQVLGVLALHGGRSFRADGDAADILESFVGQSGAAVRNARLYVLSQMRQREAEALAEVGRVLAQTLDPAGVAQRIADCVPELLDTTATALFEVLPDRSLRVMAAARTRSLTPGTVVPPGAGVVGLAVARGEPVQCGDILANEALMYPEELRASFRARSTGSIAVLAVPLYVRDQIVGVLSVSDDRARVFTPAEIRLATTFASHAVLALHSARLHAEAEGALGQLRSKNADLDRALSDLETAQERLVQGETLRALGELAGGAAHHLNNLLAVVIGRVDLMLRRPEAEALRGPLGIVERAARAAAEVVRRIQQFSRTSGSHEDRPVHLNQVAADVIEMTRGRWQTAAQAQGVSIAVTWEPGTIPAVAGDPAALRAVIANLVFNAVEAMPHGGRITLGTCAESDRVVLTVSDDGAGMTEDVQRRALEPFFTTKGVKSTGLGLSESYGIVKRHGGDLGIESAVGQGTTVTVRLPATRVPRQVPAVEPPLPRRTRALRVVLVDDETEVREAMAELLALEGHIVTQAAGARQALEILAVAAPDLVLSDVAMPDMTGWQLAAEVRAGWPSVAVGLVTGWGPDTEAPPASRAAVDFVLGKPLTLAELDAALARVSRLRESPPPSPPSSASAPRA